ncbi:MAG: GTPase Era [Desulfobacterales bacterium]
MTDRPLDSTRSSFRSGFVAILGAPNAGKSTLLNQILGQKISITSKKPQTTRNRILGILNRPSAQLVFIDTPGVHKATDPLNIRIVETALSSLGDVDVVLVIIDVARSDPTSEGLMVRKIKAGKKPVVLALNKIDLIPKTDLLPIIDRWSMVTSFGDIIPISAEKGTQVDRLLASLETLLPFGPPFFPDDIVTDLPERFIASEMIREKVFRLTGEEIPYATAVAVEAFKEEKKGSLVRIHATIHVERDSQKGIIIGKGGRMLKSIGETSRREIERFLGVKVFLKLFVRVQKNWSKDTRALRKFGY